MDETNLIKALRNAVSNLYELAEQLERRSQLEQAEVVERNTAGSRGSVMYWKTIDTAPRDGRFFIGGNSQEAIICNWPKQKNIDYAPGNWRRGRGEWNGSMILTRLPLTHWMQLPELPTSCPPPPTP